MKLKTILAASFLWATLWITCLAASPVGDWKTIDDKTHEPQAIVTISENNGKLSGSIKKLIFIDPTTSGVCEKCPGKSKGKPIQGLTFLWGLKQDAKDPNEWVGGHVLDPRTGNIYRCYVSILEGGDVLKVRGYLGIAMLGRTQYWYRV